MNYTVAVVGGVLTLSVVWFYFPKYGGVHWFQGPVRNIGVEKSGDDSSPEVCQKGNEVAQSELHQNYR